MGASNTFNSNEKETMQDLNERLSSYLQKVHQLETSNSQLEIEIKKIIESKGPCGRDWAEQENILMKLRKQVYDMIIENANIELQIDNAQLAAHDFKIKWDAELNIRQSVEMDICALRKQIDDNNIGRLHLESEIESLKEELIYIRKNHDEDVRALRAQVGSSSVQVEVDAVKGANLSKILADIRAEYEGLAQKNKEDADIWYKNKMETHSIEIIQNNEATVACKVELTELRRRAQSLEIELESLRSMNNSLENNLMDTEMRYQMEIENVNRQYAIHQQEMEKVHLEMQRRAREYEALLNAKMKLEAEIATYRRLLGGEEVTYHLKEEPKAPVVETITKTIEITQKLIDGKIVSENESVISN